MRSSAPISFHLLVLAAALVVPAAHAQSGPGTPEDPLPIRCLSCETNTEELPAVVPVPQEIWKDPILASILRSRSSAPRARSSAKDYLEAATRNREISSDTAGENRVPGLDPVFPPTMVAGVSYTVYLVSHRATETSIYTTLRNHGIAERHAAPEAARLYRLIRSPKVRGGAVFLMAAAGTAALLEVTDAHGRERPWGRYLLISALVGLAAVGVYAAGRRAGILE